VFQIGVCRRIAFVATLLCDVSDLQVDDDVVCFFLGAHEFIKGGAPIGVSAGKVPPAREQNLV